MVWAKQPMCSSLKFSSARQMFLALSVTAADNFPNGSFHHSSAYFKAASKLRAVRSVIISVVSSKWQHISQPLFI